MRPIRKQIKPRGPSWKVVLFMYPESDLGVDFLGSLLLTKQGKCNIYGLHRLLLKWIETFPVLDQTARTTA